MMPLHFFLFCAPIKFSPFPFPTNFGLPVGKRFETFHFPRKLQTLPTKKKEKKEKRKAFLGGKTYLHSGGPMMMKFRSLWRHLVVGITISTIFEKKLQSSGIIGSVASSLTLMAIRPRTRKRVFAVRRAPDGSAFEKCERCGISFPIALADMHQCEREKCVKRFRGINVNQHVANHCFGDQPVSPFRLFMESFVKICETGDLIEIDRRGFETWKNMSKKERQPYVSQAEKVNNAYQEALNKEVNDIIPVDDEADSAAIGKFDKFHQVYEESSEYYSDFSGEDDWFSIDGTRDSLAFGESQ